MYKILRKTLIFLLLIPGTILATTYSWTDKNGVTHFSDQARSSAAIIKEIPANISNQKNTTQQPAATLAQPMQISITSPHDQETIHANDGKISINTVFPAVKDAKVVLFMDNKEIAASVNGNFELNGVERGEHTLKAHLFYKNQFITESNHVTFFMWRAIEKNVSRATV